MSGDYRCLLFTCTKNNSTGHETGVCVCSFNLRPVGGSLPDRAGSLSGGSVNWGLAQFGLQTAALMV